MLGIIGNRFSIGKETYQPFSAELHYFRIEKRYWSICFERIKRAGFRIISTAVPWNVHQSDTGDVDFSGFEDTRRDLIVFLELAREFGFKVILRPGPWMSGQVPYGGLPKKLFSDIRVFARDAQGQEVKLPDSHGVSGGYLPSYLHSNFQFHLRNYFKSFIETTKNYVHPRGPVFMIELDYETSFGRMVAPDQADYNQDVLARYFPEFLEDTYEEIKKLNSAYKENHKEFETVEPPRTFTKLDIKDYPKVMDWFRFRDFMLNEYLNVLEDLFTSYTVEPLFFRSLYFRKGDLLPAFNLVPEDRAPFLGCNIFPEGSYFDLCNKARFQKAEYGFAFATSFTSGKAATDPDREEGLSPISDNVRRFYYAAGLSSGLKGMNHYMFVDRDHWYGAPLRKDGTVTEGFETAKNFNMAISSIGFEDMDSDPQIAVLVSRMNYWLRETEGKKDFGYVRHLMNECTNGLCRDMMRLKLNYGIRENRDFSTMTKYKMLIVPSTEVMPLADQEALIELAKGGVTIIMIGLMPRYDEHFKECKILSNHFRIKTTAEFGIAPVKHKDGEFPCYVYGSIRSTDDGKVKKLATSGNRIVGVCSTRAQGKFYLFSSDIASGGNHHKLTYVEALLTAEGFAPFLYCNDPSVDISFQMGDKKGLLFIVVPPPGELSDGFDAERKQIIIGGDLKQAGFAGAKLKLTNILDDEEAKPLRIAAKDFKAGVAFDVDFPDGKIFLVERG